MYIVSDDEYCIIVSKYKMKILETKEQQYESNKYITRLIPRSTTTKKGFTEISIQVDVDCTHIGQ